jgi:hypothetical protein
LDLPILLWEKINVKRKDLRTAARFHLELLSASQDVDFRPRRKINLAWDYSYFLALSWLLFPIHFTPRDNIYFMEESYSFTQNFY